MYLFCYLLIKFRSIVDIKIGMLINIFNVMVNMFFLLIFEGIFVFRFLLFFVFCVVLNFVEFCYRDIKRVDVSI